MGILIKESFRMGRDMELGTIAIKMGRSCLRDIGTETNFKNKSDGNVFTILIFIEYPFFMLYE